MINDTPEHPNVRIWIFLDDGGTQKILYFPWQCTIEENPGKAGGCWDTGIFSAKFQWESRVKNKNKNLVKSWEILFAAPAGAADVLVLAELLWAV